MRAAILLTALLAAGCVSVSSSEPAPAPGWQAFNVPGRDDDPLHYSHAVRAGDFVYISGVPAWRRANEDSDEPGIVRAFDGVRAELQAAGADWDDVIEMTTYHVDLPGQLETFARVKDRYIGAPPYPAWTAIDIDRLVPDNGTVEIRVVAYAPQH
jgi:enamine deaminase RidA (YjgF/YER057c/UK114 family)